jgi:hypothetical protein
LELKLVVRTKFPSGKEIAFNDDILFFNKTG